MQVIGAGMAMTRLEVGGNGSAGAVARGMGMAPSYPGGVRSFDALPAALTAAPLFLDPFLAPFLALFLAPFLAPFLTPSWPPTMSENKPFKLAGVMGMPVLQSRSPIIHNFWIREHGLNAAYGHLPVRIERIHEAVRGLSALGLAGCNITQPHKLAAIGLMDVLSPLARRIGAINCIVVKDDGALHGFNFDAEGFIESLLEARPGWQASDGPAVVLGAGGAARAVVCALIDRGVREIRLINRSRDKAEQLAQTDPRLIQVADWTDRHAALDGAQLLVNSTNQGMIGQPPLDLELEALPRSALVSDLIYVPLETPLLAAARARGHDTANGLGMLLHQAVPAFEAWFGVRPTVSPALRDRVLATF